jgi:hypothetical protein
LAIDFIEQATKVLNISLNTKRKNSLQTGIDQLMGKEALRTGINCRKIAY